MADVHGELRNAAARNAPCMDTGPEPEALFRSAAGAPRADSLGPPTRRPGRRVPRRTPGVGRRTTRVPQTPRPLTHRSPRWRALAVATTLVTTVAVGTTGALAGTPPAGGVSPAPVDAPGATPGGPSGEACTAAPDAFNLATAFAEAVQGFVAKQRPRYQDRYYGLDYGYSITSEDVSGTDGAVTASYHGSAYAKASGKRVTLTGTAKASFRWSGCSWVTTAFSY